MRGDAECRSSKIVGSRDSPGLLDGCVCEELPSESDADLSYYQFILPMFTGVLIDGWLQECSDDGRLRAAKAVWDPPRCLIRSRPRTGVREGRDTGGASQPLSAGAQMTNWKPACQEKVLFLSRTSQFEKGQAIRGGIPISFPWFAADSKRDRVHDETENFSACVGGRGTRRRH